MSDESLQLDKLLAAELFARAGQLTLKAQQVSADSYTGESVYAAGRRMRKVRQLQGLANRYMDLANGIREANEPAQKE